MDSQPRRSTRRLILQTRQEYEELQQREQEERDSASVRKRGLRKRERSVSSDARKKAKREREDDLYRGRPERRLPGGGRLNQTDPLPLRRSGRERKLMFSTFNNSLIERQLLNQTAMEVLRDSSEDELEPYEKLLSPQRAVRRSSNRLLPSGRPMQSEVPVPEEGEEGNKKDQEGEEGHGGDDEPEDQKKNSDKEEEEEEEAESTEQESGNGEDTENSQAEYDGFRGYYLRKRRPVIYQYQPVIQVVDDNAVPKPRRGRPRRSFYERGVASHTYQPRRPIGATAATAKRRIAAHQDSTTSCSDSDEARFQRRKSRSMQHARSQCLPMNLNAEDVVHGVIRDRARVGASLADVDPMTIDRSVTFDSIGGLQEHIKALKEMIVFPLLYSEVFERFKIAPPRGVLFHGPPGCGKTLVARALANECSKGGKQVAFFMRKGADCLSKWVGESERQLRLLFDQAYQMRPSIIFFDEIDGLAPVRSSRQDQIHSSIVSTLLALMDGLDSRGEIVVIGATNRIDAIDPALRRPGRFDREFLFPLPSVEDRRNILAIHTKAWEPPLKLQFLAELAEHTGGYCGADLKALCTEAVLHALRRSYPQIYTTTDKLVLDLSKITIAATDFHHALKRIVPTAQRTDASVALTLSPLVRPLLLQQLVALVTAVSFTFPLSWKALCRAQKSLRAIMAAQGEEQEGLKKWIIAQGVGSQEEQVAVHMATPSCNGVSQPTIPLSSSIGSSVLSSGGKKGCARHLSAGNNSLLGHPKRCDSWEPLPSNHNTPLSSGDSQRFDLPFQLSQSSDLDKIYFDQSEISQGNETEPSILQDNTCGSSPVGTHPPGTHSHHQQGANNAEGDISEHSIQSPPLVTSSYLSLSAHPHTIPQVHHPRVLVCGPPGMGQTSHLAPALLQALEDYPVRVIDLPTLYGSSTTRSPEEACTQIFREAKRMAPSIIYIPRMGSWWEVTTDTFRETFLALVHALPSSSPVLILATSEQPVDQLPDDLKELFSGSCEGVFTVRRPGDLERQMFFYEVFQKVLKPVPSRPIAIAEVPMETLPVAPNPVQRDLTREELDKLDKQRHAVMRELRIFLRDITNKLIAERKFKDFVNPVNCEEVPDYYDIILHPMDLGAVMKKIDEHQYMTPKQWVEDIDLISRNALEYNPENDTESRLLRHRALALQDMAQSFLDHELSEEFEKQCEDVTASQLRREGGNHEPDEGSGTAAESTTQIESIVMQDNARRKLRQKGHLQDEETTKVSTQKDSLDNSSTEEMIHSGSSCSTPIHHTSVNHTHDLVGNSKVAPEQHARKKGTEGGIGMGRRSITCQLEHHLAIPSGEGCQISTTQDNVSVGETVPVMEQKRLMSLFTTVVKATGQNSIEELEHIRSVFEHLIFRSRFELNKTCLLDDLTASINQLQRSSSSTY